eukprot:4388425-Pyramimonas_sp.AAC.3
MVPTARRHRHRRPPLADDLAQGRLGRVWPFPPRRGARRGELAPQTLEARRHTRSSARGKRGELGGTGDAVARCVSYDPAQPDGEASGRVLQRGAHTRAGARLGDHPHPLRRAMGYGEPAGLRLSSRRAALGEGGSAGEWIRARGDLLRPCQVLRVGHARQGLGGNAALGIQPSHHEGGAEDLQHGAAQRPGRFAPACLKMVSILELDELVAQFLWAGTCPFFDDLGAATHCIRE